VCWCVCRRSRFLGKFSIWQGFLKWAKEACRRDHLGMLALIWPWSVTPCFMARNGGDAEKAHLLFYLLQFILSDPDLHRSWRPR